ncbi:MAG TPA: hypothetical protein DIT89_01230 [Planctomycetaceae bacterium]|nr:hypothetical protein [Planctomycetaceae bacterium]
MFYLSWQQSFPKFPQLESLRGPPLGRSAQVQLQRSVQWLLREFPVRAKQTVLRLKVPAEVSD